MPSLVKGRERRSEGTEGLYRRTYLGEVEACYALVTPGAGSHGEGLRHFRVASKLPLLLVGARLRVSGRVASLRHSPTDGPFVTGFFEVADSPKCKECQGPKVEELWPFLFVDS